ncbi:PA0069 family radical SAM protein [Luteolibacter yonseiensis]|uniref:PA0069 family radical SAM protein n=1 Tax=Luteolibacter yonseiensis TaxID=1144680 RepID=A0A934VB25_9BACT|nr:PA0069 family radical SAM protein [Luteolibacter yonseiensis]MBK1815720.1 PA0069 family radical SAM protein [Luteolibacter yonseiensis]
MKPPTGRGARDNPPNRFEALHVVPDEDSWAGEDPRPLRTTFLRDDSQSILNKVESEDLRFELSVNPYRGCEHGCSYCYARVYHEYLGMSAGLDFESKIIIKKDAPRLLEAALAKPSYQPAMIAMSGVTDCYQPVERKLEITRGCLEVMARFRQPVGIVTKNALVVRDIDHLAELARFNAACVFISVTTLDPALSRILEPRASTPRARLEAMRKLADAGIPVGPSAAPMIPAVNDSELPAILSACKDAGASFASYSLVRLPGAVSQVFESWLDRHFAERKQKVLDRIRAARGGKLNSSTGPDRMRGGDEPSRQLRELFEVTCRRLGLATRAPELSTACFRRLMPGQGELF